MNVTRLFPVVVAGLFSITIAGAAAPAIAQEPTAGNGVAPVPAADTRDDAYVFAWMFADEAVDFTPRGGTTKGPAVTPLATPSEAWTRLQAPGLTKLERDRRAILAMAGGYRTSFDFLETAGFSADFAPAKPYRSWGTEYVYVVEDSPTFISLQHIIVMFFEADDGTVQGPAVVKHWRQDWHYEDTEINVYVGQDRWSRRRLPADTVEGTWSQSVYQVDDSPRYQAIGTWVHDENYSAWEANDTWRPLPRREFSVRSDYHALIGSNRHTILPTGWLHEEDNLKAVLENDGRSSEVSEYLAREYGVNRYELIVDHDFSAGDAYWEQSAAFWADVRAAWSELLANNETVTKREVEGMPMLMAMLTYSTEIEEYDAEAGRAYIDEQLARHYSW